MLFLCGNHSAQNETKKWYFGDHAGLDFMTSPPTTLTNSAMSATISCASIADANGNLLFYTDGATVYNASHVAMANGTGLTGSGGASEASIIMKQPGTTSIYYIFYVPTCSSCMGIYYSIVDMSLASGSVTTKNASLYTGYISSKLAATKHCNGVDCWLLSRQWFNTYSLPDFRAYLLTSTGISTTAVVSSPATYTFSNNIWDDSGAIKISPNGKKIGASLVSTGANNLIFNITTFEVYDFNNSTGGVSNPLTLKSNSLISSAGGMSCEFSSDGTKFYGILNDANLTTNQSSILQWDLCAGSPTAVVASIYTVSSLGSGIWITNMQLAPDGKIYIVKSNSPFLDVINSPNLTGASCNYSAGAQSLSPRTSLYSLPNFMSSSLLQHPAHVPFSYTVSNAYGCQGAQFVSSYTPGFNPAGCASSGYSLTGIQWNFGDPASGAANISSLLSPTHAYPALGTYTVKLILYYSCGGGTDTIAQSVNINQSCIAVASSSISCANPGSATVSATYGVGPYFYTWMPTGQTNSVATGLSPGTYTITVFDFGNNLTYSATTTFVSPILLTGSVNASNRVACYGTNTGTASVTNMAGGSGTVTYQWFNSTTTLTSPTPSLTAGIWSVTVTDALTGCQIHDVFYISQAPVQFVVLSSNSPSACAGGSVSLSGQTSGGTPYLSGAGYIYTWTGGPSTTTRVASQPVAGTYVYTLSSQDSLNCLISNTIAVNFVQNPVLTVNDVSICPLQTGTLNVSGASSYTWNNNPAYTGSSFFDNPTSNHQYTVLGSAFGCTSVATASIVIKGLPVAMFTSNSPICNGSNLTLSAYGGSAYAWSGPNNFNSSLQSPTINAASLNNAGVYTLTVTSANSCTSSTTQTLVINPTPTLSVAGSTVCNTQTLSLSANAAPGSSFLWHGPQSFSSALQKPAIVNPSLTQSGTYSVNVTSAAGCNNSAVAVASVVTPPSLTVSLSSNGTLCAQALNGSPNSITLTSSGASTYTLFTPNHIQNPNPSGPSSPLISVPPYNNGVATATLMGFNGVCISSITVNFSIIPNPTVSISSSTPVICAGQSYTYTNQGASSYTWGPGSPNLSTYTGPVTVASPTVTSVFSVVGGSLGCNSDTQTSTITVNPLPVFSITPEKPAICLNDQVTLFAVGNATSYNWSPYTGLNATNGFSVNANPLTEQTYTVIGSLNSCTNSAMITVSVLPLPKPIAVIENTAVCQNSSVFLQGSGGISYYWQGPENISFAAQTASFSAYSPDLSGTYTLTVKDSNNCVGSTFVSLTVYGLPNGTLLESNLQGCVPFSSNFRFRPGTTSIKSQWNLDNQLFNNNAFSFSVITAGEHRITGYLQDTLTHCVNTQTFLVEAYPLPVADFSYAPQSPIENQDEVIFSNTSSGEQLEKWNWYFISNSGYESKHKNASYLFADAGTYPVAMKVTNAWGCSDTIVRSVTVAPDFVIYVPNAFTPNGDDLNEVFLPVSRAVKFYELSVFDRWGAKLFSTTDSQRGWDGSYAGEPCKVDVYVWKISLSTNSGEMKTLTGSVLLNR